MTTFHGEDVSCSACYNAFSNELEIVLTVKEAAGYFVPAQLWRVIWHRKVVLVLWCLHTTACKGINVHGNTWWMCWISRSVSNQITQTISVPIVPNKLSFTFAMLGQHASPSDVPFFADSGHICTNDIKLKASISLYWSSGEYKLLGIKSDAVVTMFVQNTAFVFSSKGACNQKFKHLGVMGFLCKNDHLKFFSVDMFTAMLFCVCEWKAQK